MARTHGGCRAGRGWLCDQQRDAPVVAAAFVAAAEHLPAFGLAGQPVHLERAAVESSRNALRRGAAVVGRRILAGRDGVVRPVRGFRFCGRPIGGRACAAALAAAADPDFGRDRPGTQRGLEPGRRPTVRADRRPAVGPVPGPVPRSISGPEPGPARRPALRSTFGPVLGTGGGFDGERGSWRGHCSRRYASRHARQRRQHRGLRWRSCALRQRHWRRRVGSHDRRGPPRANRSPLRRDLRRLRRAHAQGAGSRLAGACGTWRRVRRRWRRSGRVRRAGRRRRRGWW